MAIIKQKRGNQVYVYEKHNYRDPVTKKVKLRSKTYLGVLDKDGNLIKTKVSKSHISNVKNYGGYFVVKEIINSIKLDKVLLEIYEDELVLKIINLIIFKLISKSPLYLQPLWFEDNYSTKSVDSKSSSKLLEYLGLESSLIELFFKKWSSTVKGGSEEENLVLDLTSISTYSSNIEYAEYGKNKDNDILEQINLGVIFNQTKKTPIAFRSYPGSIKDVTTVKNIISLVNSLKISKVLFVFDRGFYSASNLNHISSNNIDFIISMPFTTNLSKELLAKNYIKLQELGNSFVYNKVAYYCIQKKIKILDYHYNAYIFNDPIQEAKSKNNLLMKIDLIEKDFLCKQYKNLEDAEKSLGNYKKYFIISENDNKIIIEKNYEQIQSFIILKGKFILISTKKLSPENILKKYRDKDQIEKIFSLLKTGIKEKRFKTKKTETFNGRLFFNFLCLIVYNEIKNRFYSSANKINKKITLNEMWLNLNKIKIRTLVNDKIEFTELTATNKKILNSLRINREIS